MRFISKYSVVNCYSHLIKSLIFFRIVAAGLQAIRRKYSPKFLIQYTHVSDSRNYTFQFKVVQ